MGKLVEKLRVHAVEIGLLSIMSLWSIVWDYQMIGPYQRVGRIKIFLIASAAMLALHISKSWHWTIGLFWFYVIAMHLHYGMPGYGSVDVALLTATLLFLPELRKRVSRNAIENTVLGASIVHCLVGILNIFGLSPFLKVTNPLAGNEPVGLLGQPTVLGPFLCFAFAIALHRAIILRGRKGWYIEIALLNLCLIVATKSSMTYFSLAAAATVFTCFYGGLFAAYAVVLVAALLAGIAFVTDSSMAGFSGRIVAWQDGVFTWRQRPWTGFGIGSWEQIGRGIARSRNTEHAWAQLHCEPLQGLVELGINGMVLAVAALSAVFFRAYKKLESIDSGALPYLAGFAIFGTNSLANFDLHLTPHGQLFALCIFEIINQRTYCIRL